VRRDLLLHVVHHRYGRNQDNGRNDLVRMKAGMKKPKVIEFPDKRAETQRA
jgi:hypothetical protein